MTTSTMAALKANLKTALDADTDLDGVLVTYGETVDQRRETIRLGEIETGAQHPAAFRGGSKIRRRESYILHVYVEVVSKPTPADNEARAITLAGVVEDLVATDPQVSATTNLLFCYVEGMEMETTEVAGMGPRTVIDLSLQCEGNLL